MQINIKNIEIDNNYGVSSKYGCKDVIFTGCFFEDEDDEKNKRNEKPFMMRIPKEAIVDAFSCDFLTKSDLNDITKRLNEMLCPKDGYGRPFYKHHIW